LQISCILPESIFKPTTQQEPGVYSSRSETAAFARCRLRGYNTSEQRASI